MVEVRAGPPANLGAAMDITRIVAFTQSVQHVFETMLQLPVEFGDPLGIDLGHRPHDVAAVARVEGDWEGSVVLGFDRPTAERIAALMTGSELPGDSAECADALRELADMVCGAARACSSSELSIARPVVELGVRPTAAVSMCCSTDCGQFWLGLVLEREAETADRQARAVYARA
jgi:CheY-specific phosphatase CheX